MRRHADQVCVVGARRRLAGNGDLVGEIGNPRLGARARPEGKIALSPSPDEPVICSSGEQRPPGRPGSPSPPEGRARRNGRLPKKPGESGSERIQSTTFIANEKGDAALVPENAPLGRFGISRLLRVRLRLEMRVLTASRNSSPEHLS